MVHTDTTKELYVNGDIEATATLEVGGATTLSDTLDVSGVTTLSNTVKLPGDQCFPHAHRWYRRCPEDLQRLGIRGRWRTFASLKFDWCEWCCRPDRSHEL